jgi:hypothetical protein
VSKNRPERVPTPSSFKLMDGMGFTADHLEQVSDGFWIFWWDGYSMVPAWIFEDDKLNFVRWDQIKSIHAFGNLIYEV